MIYFFLYLIILIFTTILLYLFYKLKYKKEKFINKNNTPLIVCLMITGKSNYRLNFIQKSIDNFKNQSYNNKQLIILNHGFASQNGGNNNLQSLDDINNNIFEFQINKQNKTLGELRNISLQFVPINALWTPWDDDDLRSNNYLSYLYNELKTQKVDCVAFQNRYEHNLNNGFSWKINLKNGIKFVLCKQHPLIKYLDKDTLEDIDLLNNIQKNNYKIKIINNDPKIYIRIVHDTNTSVFVNKNKNKVSKTKIENANYIEQEISYDEKQYIKHMLTLYGYKSIL